MSENKTSNQKSDQVDETIELAPDIQAFFQRADEFISLANNQLGQDAHSGQVGASLMYASARYSASVASIGFADSDEFIAEKEHILDFYSKQFKQMLNESLDDYGKNFEKYIADSESK